MKNEITVGTKVRSFDFAGRELTGERACYVEGTVVAKGKCPPVCVCSKHYHILVARQVFGGRERTELVGEIVYPPLNGTEGMFGATDGVVKIVAGPALRSGTLTAGII